MFHIFLGLETIDKVLVILFILFSIYIIGAVYYVQHEIWFNDFSRAMESFISNLQAVTKRLEKEPYDVTWMDSKKY